MAYTPIDIGTADSGTGNPLRTAGQRINDAFTELYSSAMVQQGAAANLYVSTTGNDANSGTSIGSPFLTIQRAVNAVQSNLGYVGSSTINIANGTYAVTEAIRLGSAYTNGALIIVGNDSNPENVVITSSVSTCIEVNNAGIYWQLSGVTLECSFSGGSGLRVADHGRINISNMRFNACTTHQIAVENNAFVNIGGNCAVTGGAADHWYLRNNGHIRSSAAYTLTGTPSFSTAFLNAKSLSNCVITGSTFTGSATGTRYSITGNSILILSGLTLPGNAGGSSTNGSVVV